MDRLRLGIVLVTMFVITTAAIGPCFRPSSYINPDTGAPTANENVDPNSECESPDQFDTQALSPAGMTTNNVHNDACLFFGAIRLDVEATFESTGVGTISACPDPDGSGPKTATTHDHDNDGRIEHCHQTGYQTANVDGDTEYHARLNNDADPGDQTVVFCYDPGLDGCSDTAASVIVIRWGDFDEPTRAASYINPDTGAATENPDVDENSECDDPDQSDSQQLSDAGMTNRNVHNDACLFIGSGSGADNFDGPATFESSGVGRLSACPDPDGTGPKVAVTHDHDDDGSIEHCHMTGSQSTGADGDDEYHTRLNNSTTPGEQTVQFCYDIDQDGCDDESVDDEISVNWEE